MKMCDYFESFRGKWVTVQSGQSFAMNGILKDIGEDFIVIQVTEKENPYLIPNRNISYFKELHTNANGKPKIFG